MQLRDDFFRSVDRVARDRMPDIRHVHTDLVRASGLKAQAQLRKSRKIFCDKIVRHGVSRVRRVLYRHALSILRMTCDGRIHRAVLANFPVHHGAVFARKAVRLDLLRQVPVRGVVLRDDKQPARVLVNTMHNARANHAVDARKRIAAVVQQCVHKCTVIIARCRVHYHTLRLVHHK